MAQKKTAAAKTARKTIELPTKSPTKVPAKIPAKVLARQAVPLIEIAEVKDAVKIPTANTQPRQNPSAPTPSAPTPSAPTPSAPTPSAPISSTTISSKDFGDPVAVARENFEACVKCGAIIAKGAEALGAEMMNFTQASIEADLAAAKDIMAAKTPHEAIDLQTSFVQASLERMTRETAKLGELSMRFASLAMDPLRSHFDENVRTNAWAKSWTDIRPLGQ